MSQARRLLCVTIELEGQPKQREVVLVLSGRGKAPVKAQARSQVRAQGGRKTMKIDNRQSAFNQELTQLLNKYSKENNSDTPDFILCKYLNKCLDAFAMASQLRERWYGRKTKFLSKKLREAKP